MYAEHFSFFRKACGDTIHLAAHSHHWWPDVSRHAQLQAWDDAAALTDHKWNKIFQEVYPKAQRHVASHFEGVTPDRVCFAPNTHELLVRLVTSLWTPQSEVLKVVTTDSEFHSAGRQFQRWEEDGWIEVDRVAVDDGDSFPQRFLQALRQAKLGLVYLSQVFYNSGLCVDDQLLIKISSLCIEHGHTLVIDGYHGFSAIPFTASSVLSHAFYLAGGYKYAASGEGCCFLVAPQGILPRPLHTGWFASYGTLSAARAGQVSYASDAGRFLGATFDVSPLYRLNAVYDLWDSLPSTVASRHAYVMSLKSIFLAELIARNDSILRKDALLVAPRKNLQFCAMDSHNAHFVTLRLPHAVAIAEALAKYGIIVDARADRLRFGFGVYQTEQDLRRFWRRFEEIRCDLLPALSGN